MAVRETIPPEALPFSIVVLVYSLINALACKLVLFMRWKHGDRLSLISLAAIVIFISIVMLMAQEVHYIIHWKQIRDIAYREVLRHSGNPAYSFISTYNRLDTILFFIRYYCYNAQSLLFLFWAIGLWHTTRKVRPHWSRFKDDNIALCAKILAILLPIPFVSTTRTEFVMSKPVIKLLLPNIILLISITAGLIFLKLILWQYVHVHRKANSGKRLSPVARVDISFRLERRESDNDDMPTKPASASNMRGASYDRWLIVRFLVCFALGNIFQICVILYYMVHYDRNTDVLEQGGPDYSLHHTLNEVALAIPSASSGLVLFIVYGTTAPFRREYRSWFQPCRRKRQGRDGPIMVAPLDSVKITEPEALSGPEKILEEDENSIANESEGRSSVSSAWELPPLDFDEFSVRDVLPRSNSKKSSN